jgi:glycosyltransferase involved in cell wall biosynthesis
MIEAMACGTPVLAFRCGSIPEVIEDGITGRVVGTEQEAVAVLPEILSYDRRAVRRRFDERFNAARMADDYVGTYRKLLRQSTTSDEGRGAGPIQLSLKSGNGLIRHVD